MPDFSHINRVVMAVGRVGPQGVGLLGTATLLPKSGLLVTASHVTGQDDTNLMVAMKPDLNTLAEYQDTSDLQVQLVPAKIVASDPFHDLVLLSIDASASSNVSISGADVLSAGEAVGLFGYPHADHGRMVLTQQNAEVGAKILISTGGIRAKHVVLNIQARPGQSGSPVFRMSDGALVAVLIGSYAPGGGGGISLGGVDPHTLHQTTHAVSAEYVTGMMVEV